MRLPSPVAIVVFVVMAGLVGPLEAKAGGRGQGCRSGCCKHHGGGQVVTRHVVAPGQQPATKEVASGKPSKNASGKPDKEQAAKAHAAKAKVAGDKTANTDESDAGTLYDKKEKQLANFQRQRDKQLAQAEHLREVAQRNGDASLAADADRLAAQARERYARKVAHLEKFGITDPALDLDGDGFADPYWPHVDPFDDPLGEELLGSELREWDLLEDWLLDEPLGAAPGVLPLRR
jgi:hypothetical protein